MWLNLYTIYVALSFHYILYMFSDLFHTHTTHTYLYACCFSYMYKIVERWKGGGSQKLKKKERKDDTSIFSSIYSPPDSIHLSKRFLSTAGHISGTLQGTSSNVSFASSTSGNQSYLSSSMEIKEVTQSKICWELEWGINIMLFLAKTCWGRQGRDQQPYRCTVTNLHFSKKSSDLSISDRPAGHGFFFFCSLIMNLILYIQGRFKINLKFHVTGRLLGVIASHVILSRDVIQSLFV